MIDIKASNFVDYTKGANHDQEKGAQPEKHLIKVPASRMKTEMPLEYVKEVIGVQLVIIYEYLAQLLDRRWQKAIHMHHPFNVGPTCRLPQKSFSRGDTTLTNYNH